MATKHARIKARHVEVGDVLTLNGVMYMVRDGEPLDENIRNVKYRLSAGRTDAGFWYEFAGNELVDIYRDSGLPDYAIEQEDKSE